MANCSLLHTPLLWRMSSSTYNTTSYLTDKNWVISYKNVMPIMTALQSPELILNHYRCPQYHNGAKHHSTQIATQSLSAIPPTPITSPAESKTDEGQLQWDRPQSPNTSQPFKTRHYIQLISTTRCDPLSGIIIECLHCQLFSGNM